MPFVFYWTGRISMKEMFSETIFKRIYELKKTLYLKQKARKSVSAFLFI